MKYVSTRGRAPGLGFEDAMLTGLAHDGGLYVPENVPEMAADEIAALAGLSYEETALRVMHPFIGDSFSDGEFGEIVRGAYAGFGHDACAPLTQLGSNLFLLELFHGPTLSFKDFAMQLTGRLFEAALRRRGQRATVVGATSGDTGSAAIEAFRGLESADVFILYPHGRVSEVQRRQMTTVTDSNVHALALHGDFDDCQALVKDMFNDPGFRDEVSLAAVNSINWARVLAQIVYYFSSAVSLGAPLRKVRFAVPTGNFGDVFAGYIAGRMGLPVGRLTVATNRNDILHRALTGGEYRPAEVIPSMSPSMDIQVSSNFERALYYAHGCDGTVVGQLMERLGSDGGFTIGRDALQSLREHYDSARVSEVETGQAIRDFHERSASILCPHSAIGACAAAVRVGVAPIVALATAHPAKFPAAVRDACGQDVPLPPRLANLYELPERTTEIANDPAALKSIIRERLTG